MKTERVGTIIRLLLAGCAAALVLGSAASKAAGDAGATGGKSAAAGPATDAKQQVLELEDKWVEAENKHDAATLERILDDKFLASSGVNKPRDKETFIKQITSGEVDPTLSQTLTDRTVIVDGDTAVVIGTDTVRGTANGSAYTAAYRYTVTYIHRKGRWVALAEHLVKAPKEEK